MRWCRGCAFLRGSVAPPLATCKSGRLCQLVDRELILRRRNRSLDEYRQSQQAIEAGHAAASRLAAEIAWNASATEFIDALIEVHKLIFIVGDTSIAGRFRREGEIGEVDTHRHVFQGVAPAQIEAELDGLWTSSFIAQR